jgi:protein phosphatase
VKKGEITAQEAEIHPQRNILTNAMGTKPTLRVDTGKCPLTFSGDDRLLLCSDGLYDYLKDDELKEMLIHRNLNEAAHDMISEAKKRGGHDNITVVLAERIDVFSDITTKETKDFNIPATKEYDLS